MCRIHFFVSKTPQYARKVVFWVYYGSVLVWEVLVLRSGEERSAD